MQLKDFDKLKVYIVTKDSDCGTLLENDHFWLDDCLNCIEAQGFIPIADVQEMEVDAMPCVDHVVVVYPWGTTHAMSIKSDHYRRLMESIPRV